MAKQLGFFIEIEKCAGCKTCVVGCKSENNTPVTESFKKATNWRWVVERDVGTFPNPKRVFVTMACFHCAQPACIAACPVEAAIIKREDDGIVLIDQDKCVGCRRCEFACPYGAPQMNFETEKVEKCTFCVHRLEAGLNPACVDTCVGRALHFGDMEEIKRKPATVERFDGFADPQLTYPSVRFKVEIG